MPGVPDGEGTQDGQLAARLDHLAHLFHLHDVAKVGKLDLCRSQSRTFVDWKSGLFLRQKVSTGALNIKPSSILANIDDQ